MPAFGTAVRQVAGDQFIAAVLADDREKRRWNGLCESPCGASGVAQIKEAAGDGAGKGHEFDIDE